MLKFRCWTHGQMFSCSLHVLLSYCSIIFSNVLLFFVKIHYFLKKTILDGMKLGIEGSFQLDIRINSLVELDVVNLLPPSIHTFIHQIFTYHNIMR